MKKFFFCVLALSVLAAGVTAAEKSLEDRVDVLQAQIDRAMAKAGIHFNGEFRSQFLSSTVSGDSTNGGKRREGVEYTSVDFDIVARPNTALSARAMFRLHQDWRNFFSDVQNPITTRWLSIDGSMMNGILKYNVGDYQKKLTPLTLWSPDLEFLFEPEIFAENRRLAASEMFLGDNNRALQGANIEFKAELYPILHDVEVGFFGARLAARGSGESGVISPGVATESNGEYWDADYDKYLLGTNLSAQVVKGAGAGISSIHIFDNVNSYRGDSLTAKVGAEQTNVIAGRLNADNRIFMDDEIFNVGVNAEFALSAGKDYRLNPQDPAKLIENNEYDKGTAVNAGLSARVSLGEANTIRFSADVIMNDSAFRNDAAQSPTFIQRRIMNNENSLSGSLDPNLGLMNPFDALYRSVFKYTPSQYFGNARPFTKNAYINSILSKDQQADITASDMLVYPNPFQTALPGGMATADRSGPVVKICGSFLDNALDAGAKIAAVNTKERDGRKYVSHVDTEVEVDGDFIIKSDTTWRNVKIKGEFLEAVGGVGVDIAKFAPVVGPSLKVGGSYGMYNANCGDEGASESGLMSAEVNYQFAQRFAFLFGYQQLTSIMKSGGNKTGTHTFDNMAFGFNYKVAEGGSLTAKLGMLSGKFEPNGGTAVEYSALQPEVYLTVKF